jgi:tRNA pseudouridine38-40 synthase
MRTIKLLIAYDGTDFCGWQRQAKCNKTDRSVQAVIESALERMHGHPVSIAGAGRTDSGVHAAGQVASFRTDINSIQPGRFVPALNSILPRDLRILRATEVHPDFHARFDARMRTYRYHFICCRQALPHESRYALQVWRNPRIDVLNAYCRLLLGEKDCTIFAASEGSDSPIRILNHGELLSFGQLGVSRRIEQKDNQDSVFSVVDSSTKSRSRYISNAVFFAEGNRLIFEISANAFLRKMVRSVAGTLLHYEEHDMPQKRLQEIFASGDRSLAGPTLPPQGLFLWKVDYYRE